MEDGEIEEGMVTADEYPTSEAAMETVATPREPVKSPLELLRESKTSVEEIVGRMLSIKKEGNNKSEIRELLTQMFLNFVNLRQVSLSPHPSPHLHHVKLRVFSFSSAGESRDIDGGRQSEGGDGTSERPSRFHDAAIAQSHVREEPLRQSY